MSPVTQYFLLWIAVCKYKFSCEGVRNPRGIPACMTKMPAIVVKRLEVLRHVWPSNISMFISPTFWMFAQLWSAVTPSPGMHPERSHQCSGTKAGVIPAPLRGCCPAALKSQPHISWGCCWVWAQMILSSSSRGCKWWDLSNEHELGLSDSQHWAQPRKAAVPPPLPAVDNLSFEGR